MPLPEGAITIALDARTVHRSERRGTGKNLVDLYRSVLKLRPNWRVIGYHRGDEAAGLNVPGYTPKFLEMPGYRFDAWQRWRLPMAAWRDGADLLHCPANTCPRWLPVPTMLTVHDLMPLDSGDAVAAQRLCASIEEAVRRRLTIITPSEFTAGELVSRFGAHRENIVVNAWAPDGAMRYIDDERALTDVLWKYAVHPGTRTLLHLGAPDPRKNTGRTIEAFAGLNQSIRQSWTLLIVGVNCLETRQNLVKRCENLGISDRVRIHGFADEADMPALFSAADVLVYPSLSEGFGLPILDAFATRTAVLTSSATSLPEVGGDAARYVDPTCVASVRRGLWQLTAEPILGRDLVQRGLVRLQQYSWDKTAARFIGAVEQTLTQREVQLAAA